MIPYLIHLRPLDLLTGQRIDIYVGSASDATALGQGGIEWEPAIARRPRIAQDLMSLDLDGKFKLAAADFVLSLNQIRNHPDPYRLTWGGARLTIYSVADLSWSRRVVEFNGIVSNAPPDLITNRLTVNATVDRTRVDKPLLTNEFTGGGGEGGDATMRGKPMPAGFGYVENVEWVLFDTINNIGMLDGYGNLLSVVKAMEGLNDLGPSVGDYPTYQALKDAITGKVIPPGRWGTCIAKGMVGFGAPLTGRVSFVATFGSNRTGAILKRIMTVHGKIAAVDINSASFDALDAGANVEVRAHWREQIQIADVIEKMCQPLNATPLITVQNQIAVTRAAATDPVFVLNRNGSSLPVITDWRMADVIDPLYKVIYRVEQPASVFTFDQVNYADDLADLGLYSPDTTYRQGNIVWLADKSQWLYINDTPTKGNLPAEGSAYWKQMQPGTDANTIRYPSGFTLADKEPGEKGANITETRSAASFYGQGALATQSQLANGSQYLTGFGTLSGLGSLYFGSPYLLESNGGVSAGLGAFKTILGIASSFTGQGALATLSQLSLGSNFLTGFGAFAGLSSAGYGSPYLTGFGALSPLSSISFGSNYLLEQAGGASASLSAFKTSLGTASGILGQGIWATAGALGRNSIFGGFFNADTFGLGSTLTRNNGSILTEGDAVTSLGTAAGIIGQGPGATATGAQVLNNSLENDALRIAAPTGASYGTQAQTVTGALKIILPQLWTSTMMRFDVQVFNYTDNTSGTYTIAGYNYAVGAGAWINCSAQYIGADGMRRPVRWGFENGHCVIYIGNDDSTWSYPQIRVVNFQAGYRGVSEALWATGWSIAFGVVPAANITATVANPNAGEARYGINILENTGVPASLANFKTILGIASGFTGQGGLATRNAVDLSTDQVVNRFANYLFYDNAPGITIQALRPQEAGSNVTENRTSAAITGQGAMATLNYAALGSRVTDSFGTVLSNAQVVTIQGVASGISGQGSLATKSNVTYGGSEISNLPLALQPSNFFASGYMFASSIFNVAGNKNLNDYYPEDVLSNRTEVRTSAAIVGQGPGATAVGSDVLNNRELSDQTSIPLPGGAAFSASENVVTGAFKITLPVRASFTMMRFYVDVFNYNTGETTTYLIAGYNYDGGSGAVQWYNVSANVIGSSARALPVRFGDDGTKACIYIGDTSTTWSYPKVVVRDWLGGHQGFQASVWKAGWSVTLATSIQGQSASVDQPIAGDAAFGLNTRERFGGPIATVSNFKTVLGTSAGFTGQGPFATASGGQSLDNVSLFGMPTRLAPWANNGNYLDASRMVYPSGQIVRDLEPQEAGGNKTETRTAAAITGQGGLATKSQITTNNQLGGYVGTRLAAHPLNDNFLGSGSIAYLNGTGMEPLKPQEGGANVTENRTSASITGQGPGATAVASKVLNNSTDGNVLRIPAPVGGAFGTTANSLTGPIRITLPQGFISTMMKFEVEVYNYQDQAAGMYTISGYSYSDGYWTSISAQYVGSDQYRRNVRFASENGKVVVYIGELNTVWNYPQIRVINFQAGYNAYVEDYYATGWSIAINNAAFQNVNGTITPHAGETKFGLNLLESTGVPATIPAFKTNQGTAAGIAGQGGLATVNAITNDGQLGGNVGTRLAGHPLNDTYLSASTIAYAQGAGLESLKPQEGGANVTESRTSAAIVGQSGFATASVIGRDRLFSAGFFALNAFSLGYSITRSDGSTTVTESMTITQLGVAAGFVNQGSLATRNNVNLNDIQSAGLFTSRVNGQGRGFELDNGGLRSYSDNGTLTVELAF